LFLSHSLTPLSSLPFHHSVFFPFKICYHRGPATLLIGLALTSGGSILAPASIGFIKHWGSFLQLLTEATPIAPRYQNLATQTHNNQLTSPELLLIYFSLA